MLVLLFPFFIVFVQNKSFRWNRWEIDMAIEDDGSISVREEMEIDFTFGRFTFGYRSIPIGFRGRNDGIEISSIKVFDKKKDKYRKYKKVLSSTKPPYTFSVKKNRIDEVKIDFNFPARSGSHTYIIEYKVLGAVQILDEATKDGNQIYQLFWKVIPADHPAEVINTIIRITLPKFSKVYGVGNLIINGNYIQQMLYNQKENQLHVNSDKTVWAEEIVEVKTQFISSLENQKTLGIVNNWQDQLRVGDTISIFFLLISLCFPLIPFVCYFLFYRGQRTPKGNQRSMEPIPDILYVQPLPRDGSSEINIAEFGHLHKNGKSIRILMAQMVDLALKGHIRITDNGSGRFQFTRLVHENNLDNLDDINNSENQQNHRIGEEIQEEEEDSEEVVDEMNHEQEREPLDAFERKLLDYLFYGRNVVQLSDLKYRFSQHLGELYDDLDKSLVEKGYRTSSISSMRSLWMGVIVVLGVITFFTAIYYGEWYMLFFGYPLFIGWFFFGILGFIVTGVFATYLLFTTDGYKGHRETLKAKAFKKYMDRILSHENPSSRLHKELFERYLPYSILFGIEKKWSDHWAKSLEKKDNNTGSSGGCYRSCYYYDDYFFYRSWYGIRNHGMHGSSTMMRNAPLSGSTRLFSEGFGSRFSSMISNTSRTLSSVKPSKSSSGGSSSGSSSSGGGGSAGFG